MLRIIIPFLTITLCTNYFLAQKDLNSKLLSLEMASFYANSDSIKNDFILQKAQLYLTINQSSIEVLNEIKRIDFSYLKEDSIKENLLWNASIVAYLNNDIYYALHYINEYETLSKDSSNIKEILKLLIYSKYNPNTSSDLIMKLSTVDSKFACLNCLNELQEFELIYKLGLIRLSYFFPGMGMMLNGNILKGTTALLLNTSTAIAIRWLFLNNLYINMASWGTNLIIKFYFGNIQLTKKLIDKKESIKRKKLADNCELSVSKVLSEYPLEFK